MEGQVFRIKTDNDEDPNNWTKAVFFNPNSAGSDHQHINTALSVAQDDDGRVWVYFGTGRFWSVLDREAPYLSYQNSFYGIKEPVDADGNLTYGTVAAKETRLKNVTDIEIEAPDEPQTTGRDHLTDVENDIKNNYDGWYLNFSETGERNLGQAAVFGDVVTFSTYVPNSDVCAAEGESYLYGLYYKTGTAYYEGVLITDTYLEGIDDKGTEDETDDTVLSKLDAGKGYSTTPNIHIGEGEGSKAFLQTSTGAIIGIKQANPGITKSGKVSWQDF